MTTLPALTSPVAGSILRRGAPVIVLDGSEASDILEGHRIPVGARATLTDDPTDSPKRWCIVAGATVDPDGPPWSELPAAALALDLSDDLGQRLAEAWLGRHHGIKATAALTWAPAAFGIWDLRDFPTGAHVGFTGDEDTARRFSDPKRGLVHYVPGLTSGLDRQAGMDPVAALALACLAAVSR
jgi:hypothetical protein